MKVISYCNEKPITSVSRSGVPVSRVARGLRWRRSASAMSGHGQNTRSATVSSLALIIGYRIRNPRWDIPISYTSGKASANFRSTFAWSLTIWFHSPPM